MSDDTCMVCVDARVIVQCVETEKLLSEVVEMLKLVLCSKCNKRFPDIVTCEAHKRVYTKVERFQLFTFT